MKDKLHEQIKQIVKVLEIVKSEGNLCNTRELLKNHCKSLSVHKTLLLCAEYGLIARKQESKCIYNTLTEKGERFLKSYHTLAEDLNGNAVIAE